MAKFSKLQRFRPKGKGLLARMQETIDAQSAFLENIKAGNGIITYLNAEGGMTFESNGGSGGGGKETEGDYAFKVTATEDLDNGNPFDPPRFTVSVLGGTAQVYGGNPFVYDDCGIGKPNDPLWEVPDGSNIFIVYHAFNESYNEVASWEFTPLFGDATTIAGYEAPYDLVFEIACVSKNYAGNVRQDHKGNIVMPAISNLVDLQAEYVEAQ